MWTRNLRNLLATTGLLAITITGANAQYIQFPSTGNYGGSYGYPLAGGYNFYSNNIGFGPYGGFMYDGFYDGLNALNGTVNLLNVPQDPVVIGSDGTVQVQSVPGTNVQNVNTRRVMPRTSDFISAKKLAGNRLRIDWQGDTTLVSRITFALLDKSQGVIRSKTITALPAAVTFTRTPRSAYYQVIVEYGNGTTNQVIAPL